MWRLVPEDLTRFLPRAAAFAAVVALAAALPSLGLTTVWQGVALQIVISACAALGMTLLFGYAGQLSFAQAAFAGCGAYATGIISVKYGGSPWWGLLVGVVVAMLFAAIVGYPVLRLQDLYLALATAALNIGALVIVLEQRDFTGGAAGLPGLVPLELFGLSLLEPKNLYYVALAAFVLMFLLAYRLITSPVGAQLAALRHSQRAASLAGIGIATLKTKVFVVAAGFAAVSGFFLANYLLYVPPDSFSIVPSIFFLVMVVIGGVRSLTGAVVGAAFVTIVPQLLPEHARAQQFIFAIAFLVITVFAREGLMGMVTAVWRRISSEFTHGREAAPAPAASGSSVDNAAAPSQSVSVSNRWETAQSEAAEKRPVLEGAGLAKRFGGVQALSQVSFSVRPAELFAIIGPNGAGKTTLLNVITGLWRPDEGQIKLGGVDITRSQAWTNARRGLARTLQTPVVFPDMSVRENVMLGYNAVSRTGFVEALVGGGRGWQRTARSNADALLEMIGLSAEANRNAAELPLALQRLVEIGRALATQPRVILLDEPAAGLAQTEVMRLADVLKAAQDLGTAVCLVEHNMRLVMSVAERILVLHHGVPLFEGTPTEVQQHPEVIDAYLGRRSDGKRRAAPATT